MQKNIDIFNKNNQPLGIQTSIDHAMRQGLWHRGAHVTVFTTTGEVLVQKRSRSMLMHPRLLDISCGGIVDAGEEPIEAAVRELYEEVGIKANEADLVFLGIHRANHAFPKIRRIGRSVSYCYALQVSSPHVGSIQQEEVEWARFIPLADARRLVRKHRLRNFGRLIPHYGLYKTQLRGVDRLMKQASKR